MTHLVLHTSMQAMTEGGNQGSTRNKTVAPDNEAQSQQEFDDGMRPAIPTFKAQIAYRKSGSHRTDQELSSIFFIVQTS